MFFSVALIISISCIVLLEGQMIFLCHDLTAEFKRVHFLFHIIYIFYIIALIINNGFMVFDS